MNSEYNLEKRHLNYAAEIIRLGESLPRTPSGRHVSGQLLPCGTAPMSNHGEAQATESRNDFNHKMKNAHKELRESIRLINRVPLSDRRDEVSVPQKENDQLIRIFHASIRTAQTKDSP